jgi:hypothetical protein
MNPIKRIWNAITSTDAAPVAGPPAAATLGFSPISEEKFRQLNHRATLDDFQVKYGMPPFFYDGVFRGDTFLASNRPPISSKQKKLIIEKTSPLCSADDLKLLAEYHAEWARFIAMESEANWNAVTNIWQAEQTAAHGKLLAGEPITIRSQDQIRAEITGKREVIHLAKVTLSKKVYDLLLPMGEKLESVCRGLTESQDSKERGAHIDLVGEEVPFVPSQYLRAMAFVALTVAAPVKLFNITKNLPPPHPDKLLEFWLPGHMVFQPPMKPTPPAPVLTRQPVNVPTPSPLDHAAKVAEINVWTEKFKAQIATEAAQKAAQ